jgi:predicted transcriptional regulator of viral defense system
MDKGVWKILHDTNRLVFTTREVAELSGISISSMTQKLSRLEESKMLSKIMKGVWGFTGDKRFSPFLVVPFLSRNHRCYVSYISAMHIYGMISQIPQVITIATTAHSKKIKTSVATFQLHQVDANFFKGFDWNNNGDFLIAEIEKAFIDSLYISSRKGNRYSSFPEIEFPKEFNKSKAIKWLNLISSDELKKSVLAKLKGFL